MSKTSNIEQSYQEWFNNLILDPKLDEAFEAGFAAGSLVPPEDLTDARLVILARQEITIEQQKQRIAQMFEGVRKAREAVNEAARSLDQLRDFSWMS